MKLRLSILQVLVLLGSFWQPILPVAAQDFVFKVLASKGRAQVMPAATSDAQPAKIGQELYSGDHVITVDEDYIGLLHNTGKTIEIQDEGVYPVDELQKRVPPVITNIIIKLGAFIDNKFNELESEEDYDYRQNLAAVAATERATEGYITLLVKEKRRVNPVYGGRTTLRWYGSNASTGYQVNVLNGFGDLLGTVDTDQEYVEIDFAAEAYANDQFFIVNIRSTDSEINSSNYQFQRITAANDITEIQTALDEFNEPTASHALMLGLFFEEKGLFVDALSQYERAVRISPDVEFYRQIRGQFIIAQELGR